MYLGVLVFQNIPHAAGVEVALEFAVAIIDGLARNQLHDLRYMDMLVEPIDGFLSFPFTAWFAAFLDPIADVDTPENAGGLVDHDHGAVAFPELVVSQLFAVVL